MSCSAHNTHDKKTESKDQKLSNQLEQSPNLSDGTGLNNSITGSMRSKYFKDLLNESMDYSEDSIESSEITEIKSRISSSCQQILNLPENKLSELYAEQKGPQIYDVPSSNTSKNTIVNKLPEVFGVLPVFGKPNKNEPKDQYYENKILDFMNIKLNPDEFKSIIDYCSPEHLKTGEEVEVPTNTGLSNITSFNPDDFKTTITPEPDSQLAINRHYKFNLENDMFYSKHLKYRRVRLLPLPNEEPTEESDCLVPGKDIICQVKVYRPYPYNSAKLQRIRHSVCVCDIMLHGDQPLTMLRDRIACTNDLDMRIDVSEKLDDQPKTTAKEVFPSGFLFINNIFYVDTRPGCKDLTEVIRKWAISKGIGEFPHKDMGSVLMRDLTVRMGHPEVYVHQGDCEHIFTVSDIRVVTNDDPLNKNVYPFNSIVSATQNAYCATCAEFCAKWVVTESSRIPFDPAYFCDTCLKLYMYLDGKKIGDFKVYSFKGNDVHLFKPI